MARIRTIKPEFWSDEKVGGLPLACRLLFIGLWNFADDYGVIASSPLFIKAYMVHETRRSAMDLVSREKERAGR